MNAKVRWNNNVRRAAHARAPVTPPLTRGKPTRWRNRRPTAGACVADSFLSRIQRRAVGGLATFSREVLAQPIQPSTDINKVYSLLKITAVISTSSGEHTNQLWNLLVTDLKLPTTNRNIQWEFIRRAFLKQRNSDTHTARRRGEQLYRRPTFATSALYSERAAAILSSIVAIRPARWYARCARKSAETYEAKCGISRCAAAAASSVGS